MPQIDTAAIREAINRRSAGGASPAMSQVSSPGASLPTGGPNVPVPSTPPVQMPPTPPQAPVGPQGAVSGAKPKLSQVANFDDETKNLVKQLISKLMTTL